MQTTRPATDGRWWQDGKKEAVGQAVGRYFFIFFAALSMMS